MTVRTREPRTRARRYGSPYAASLLVAALAGTLSCGGDGSTAPTPQPPPPPPPPPPVATSLTVRPATAELDAVGATVQLSAEVLDQNGRAMPGAAVAWSSGDESVATVDAAGLATAVGDGQAAITATSGSASGSATVTVAQVATAVSVSPATASLEVGDTLRLSAEATDANGHAVAGAEFAWSSGDESVAMVDDAGLVTAVAEGEAEVTATSGSASGSAAVSVSPPPVPPEPVGTMPDQTLTSGQTATVDASEYFDDPDGGDLSYAAASSDSAVATAEVSESEVTVAGTGPGTATVTVTATDPDGLSAEQSFGVVVSGSVEDDFESEASLNDWEAANAEVAVADGALAITNQTEGRLGLAKRREMPSLTEWTIQARMGRTTRRARPGVVSLTGHGRFTAVRLVLRTLDDEDRDRGRGRVADVGGAESSRNYEFAVFDGGAGEWVLLTNLSGNSESVSEEPGAFTDIEFGHEAGDFVGYAGPSGLGDELFRVDLADARVDGVPLGEIVSDVTGLWLANQGPVGSTALHDRVRVTGTGSDATPPDEAEIEDTSDETTRNAPVEVPVVSVTVTPQVRTLVVGDTLRLSAGAYDADGHVVAGAEFSWSSSEESVATVGAGGLVTAVAPGSATVTATAGGVTGSSEVSVRSPVASVSVTPSEGTLVVGDTLRLSAGAYDADGVAVADAEFSWSSSDESVATVGAGGLVTAVAPGSATVTATADGVTGSSEVSVRSPVASVSVTPSEGTLPVGDTLRLSAEAYDADGVAVADAEFSWSSSDEAVATVDVGLLTAVAEGSATITATADGVTGSSEIAVFDPTNPDRAALTALYGAAGGPDWSRSGNWLTNAPLGDWYGVTVNDAGRVVSLNLARNNLSGGIPPELGGLADLEMLWLELNFLTGEIPPELGDLAALKQLDLEDNELTGSVPRELSLLENLEHLNLYTNGLTGEIPVELGTLVSLELLDLGANRLSGSIPPELGNLTRLEWLGLDQAPFSNASLSGPIPPELGNLTKLEKLYLGSDPFADAVGLTGPIPPELGNLANLTDLGLGYNGLTGPIPPELGNLANLGRLGLSGNQFTGPIPTELGNLAHLTSLMLDHNELTDRLPESFLGLSLEIFWWDNNAGLCAPDTSAFRAWLEGIGGHNPGPFCSGAAGWGRTMRVGPAEIGLDVALPASRPLRGAPPPPFERRGPPPRSGRGRVRTDADPATQPAMGSEPEVSELRGTSAGRNKPRGDG